MNEYIQLISSDKKNYYVPKRIAYLSEYMKKEIESNKLWFLFLYYIEIDTEKMIQIPFEDITFEILEVIVEYLNTKVNINFNLFII